MRASVGHSRFGASALTNLSNGIMPSQAGDFTTVGRRRGKHVEAGRECAAFGAVRASRRAPAVPGRSSYAKCLILRRLANRDLKGAFPRCRLGTALGVPRGVG